VQPAIQAFRDTGSRLSSADDIFHSCLGRTVLYNDCLQQFCESGSSKHRLLILFSVFSMFNVGGVRPTNTPPPEFTNGRVVMVLNRTNGPPTFLNNFHHIVLFEFRSPL